MRQQLFSIGTRTVELGTYKEGRVGANRLNTDMFLERKNISPELRRFNGRGIKAPSQAYVQTISDLANFKASDNFFEEVAELSCCRIRVLESGLEDGNNYGSPLSLEQKA